MNSARAEWKKYWTVVLAAAGGTFIGSLPTYTLGIFINPLEQAFGWSRAGISAAVTIYATVGVLGAAAAGVLLDRMGTRRMGIYAAIVFCIALAGLSLVTSELWSWWAAWVVVGFIGLGLKPAVWSKAVGSFFFHGRGMALAAMLCGSAFGSSLMPQVAHWLIDQFGWRQAFIGLGALTVVLVIPILFLFLYDGTDGHPAQKAIIGRSALPGWTIAEGFRRRELYQIAIAALITTTILSGYIIHIVPMLISIGLDRDEAVETVAIVGFMSLTARLVVGHLFDRFGSPLIGAISLSTAMAPGLVLLYGVPGLLTATCAVIAFGICAGGEYDAVIYLSSRYFGMRAFGTLFGVVETALLAGVGLGPLLAGYIFDRMGSYHDFFLLTIPLSLFAGLQMLTLKAYPDHGAGQVPP
ncbi:MFS transporter [Sphingobium sp.]|uniref:MFS transporter n=1 Tax=Sphingobium sp. TaxID=1912891 RepID=UPI002B9F35F8|nr:MFS transporter [Sphingobium sp.]HUD89977.1 MFS transporter [Sphingobium sp.]